MKKAVYSLLIFVVFALLIVSCSTASTVTKETQPEIAKPAVENKAEETKAEAPKVENKAEEPKAEAPKAEAPKTEVVPQALTKTYEYMGYYLKVTIGNGVAYVEYPSIIAKSDIDNAVAAAVSVYGTYLKDISYTVKDGVITVNFPKTYGEEELLLAEKIISAELPAYVESLFEETPVTAKVQDPATSKVITKTVVSGQDLIKTYEYMGYYVTATIGNGVAYVEYPSIIAKSDIDNAVAAAVSVYGAYLKDISYTVKDGVITVNFPKTYGEEELLLAEKIISAELPAYVASLFEATPVAVEVPAAETVKEQVKEEVKAETVAKAEPAKAETPVKVAEVPVVQEEPKKGSAGILIIILVVLIAAGLAYYFLWFKKKNEK